MGQKVNPHGMRVGIIKDWSSKWFTDDKHLADYIIEDNKIREFLKKKLYAASVSKIDIERTANRIKIIILTAKPGIVIGRGGSGIEAIKKDVLKLISTRSLNISIEEVKNPEADAQLVAENIAAQLEKRISFRKAMKQSIQKAMKIGVKGVKTQVAGRIGGAEIARTERYHEGTIPLHTLRADIDYGFAEANTTYGKIGVKTWIYKGEVLPVKKHAKEQEGGEA